MRIVTDKLLAELTIEAQAAPRLRKNYNLHPDNLSKCHRLLNAVEPASYIPPHRHLDPEKDEAFIIVSGRLGVVTFEDDGTVRETVLLSRESGNLAADIPAGIFHTAVALDSGTLFFEAKAGPYLPLADNETASFAPSENEPAASDYLEKIRAIFSIDHHQV